MTLVKFHSYIAVKNKCTYLTVKPTILDRCKARDMLFRGDSSGILYSRYESVMANPITLHHITFDNVSTPLTTCSNFSVSRLTKVGRKNNDSNVLLCSNEDQPAHECLNLTYFGQLCPIIEPQIRGFRVFSRPKTRQGPATQVSDA